MRVIGHLILIFTLAILLAACSGAGGVVNSVVDPAPAQPTEGGGTENEPAAEQSASPAATTPTPYQEDQSAAPVESVDPMVQAGGDDSAAPPAGNPTPRSGLEATDPGGVKLASGRVQLVEFFAFW